LKIVGFKVVVCCLLVAPVVLFAQTSFSDGALAANPIFRQNCAKCHGKTAEGRRFGGPSLVSSKVTDTSADDLRSIISNGKHRMPKFEGKLTPEEIDTLVQQIRMLSKK
jgi:mono/diheme cytochrome c family protein